MGGSYSQLPSLPENFPYFCLVFRADNKIRVVNGNADICRIIRKCLQDQWIAGIKEDTGEYEMLLDEDEGIRTFKLYGSPFGGCSKQEAVSICRVLCAFLSSLDAHGYELVTSSKLSRTAYVGTWFFRQKNTNHASTTPALISALNLRNTDGLQLVNAPSELNDVLVRAANTYMSGTRQENVLSRSDFEVKLDGSPWNNSELQMRVAIRRMLLVIIKDFHRLGFRLMATADLTISVDVLFFIKERSSERDADRVRESWMMSLDSGDKVRLIDAPREVLNEVRQVLNQYWFRGIKHEQSHSAIGCYELKLKGDPWETSGEEGIASRLVITVLLQTLLAKGWALLCTLTVSRRTSDKPVLLFRRCAPASVQHCCMAPGDSSRLRLINTDSNTIERLDWLIDNYWPSGVSKDGPITTAYEWKLRKDPWCTDGNLYAVVRFLLMMFLHDSYRHGWRVVCSMDASSKYVSEEDGPGYKNDVDCWFMARTTDVLAEYAPALPARRTPHLQTAVRSSTPTTAAASSIRADDPPPSYNEVMRGIPQFKG